MPSANLHNPTSLLTSASHSSLLDMRQSKLGLLYALAIPIAAGVTAVGGIRVGPVSYTGLVWMGMLGFGLLLVLTEKALHRGTTIYFPVAIWSVWFGYIGLSLLWCEQISGRSIQDTLQLTMPLMVAVATSMFIRTESELRVFLRCFVMTLGILVLCVICSKVGLISDTEEGISLAPRVLGLTAALIGAVLLAQWPAKRVVPLVGWGVCLLLTIATGSRTATAALLCLPIVHPGYRNPLVRLVSVSAIAAAGLAIFHSQTFQQRFFYSGSGTLTDVVQGNFLGFGRFYAWPLILEEAWNHPVLGAGVGTTYDFVPTVWHGMTHVHNDYLRIGFEFGLVGLAIFLTTVIWQVIRSHRQLRHTQGVVRVAWCAVFLGWSVYLLTACTDNPLIYNLWFMNPLFALMGAVYGVSGTHNRQEEL